MPSEFKLLIILVEEIKYLMAPKNIQMSQLTLKTHV